MLEITKTLEKFGLSNHEIKAYIALLKLVEATASAVAETAELPRTSAYTALELLKKKA